VAVAAGVVPDAAGAEGLSGDSALAAALERIGRLQAENAELRACTPSTTAYSQLVQLRPEPVGEHRQRTRNLLVADHLPLLSRTHLGSKESLDQPA
jgi:hypothetical protein